MGNPLQSFSYTSFSRTLSVLLLLIAGSAYANRSEIQIGQPTGNPVSPLLTGFNIVYSHEDMDTWRDGVKSQTLKDSGINCLRYPGGHVVSFWDWEFPFHETYENFWDPAYIKSLTPGKRESLKTQNTQRMLLDDFLGICATTGSEPIVGINMFQGYKFDRLEDSIAKAVRLVKEIRKQNPRVKYYYLDNEAGHQPEQGKHVPIDDYIRLIPVYSRAIKAVQPDAKLIVNPIRWGRVREMIGEVGEHFDIVDNHWYYSNRKWGLFYIDDWREEQKNKQFEQEMAQFESWKTETGNGHLQMAVLEWNLGPARGTEGSDVHSYLFQGLVQADMLMYFIEHEIFMAACWPLMWAPDGPRSQGQQRNFFDPASNQPSSSKTIFKWFSMAGNGTVLATKSALSGGIHSTAVLDREGETLLLYVLNKSRKTQDLTFNPGMAVNTISAEVFHGGADPDHVVVEEIAVSVADAVVSFEIPDTSLVFLRIGIE